jgi:hypothetical protein
MQIEWKEQRPELSGRPEENLVCIIILGQEKCRLTQTALNVNSVIKVKHEIYLATG